MFEDRKTEWLKKADNLKPELIVRTVRPVSGIPDFALKENESIVLDFGNHFVGRLSLKLESEGSHPDAPAWLEFKFCENIREVDETAEDYHGWISKSWIQQEQVHIDILPSVLSLPRRYAFRYVKIKILALSSKYSLVIRDVFVRTETSADDACIKPLAGEETDAAIDKAALRTLRNCMQDVFEDGPKRDRRLWLGDLRLQALTNSVTFRNFNLVKRCLYLFACTADRDGRIPACLFTEPEVSGDDTYLFDYSLFFLPTLLNYMQATGDLETVSDLLPLAFRQLEIAERQFDPGTNLICDDDRIGWCFVDWNLGLNKQFCAHAIWIYCAKAALQMQYDPALELQIEKRKTAAFTNWYDEKRHLFISGAEKQISWASQIWGILAGIIEGSEAEECLAAVEAYPHAVEIVTPYMMHHYVEALCHTGQKEKARMVIRNYWGGMVKNGADTFWELYNPQNPEESPYGSSVVNSYCHAWSCTPAWFYRSGILEAEYPKNRETE